MLNRGEVVDVYIGRGSHLAQRSRVYKLVKS